MTQPTCSTNLGLRQAQHQSKPVSHRKAWYIKQTWPMLFKQVSWVFFSLFGDNHECLCIVYKVLDSMILCFLNIFVWSKLIQAVVGQTDDPARILYVPYSKCCDFNNALELTLTLSFDLPFEHYTVNNCTKYKGLVQSIVKICFTIIISDFNWNALHSKVHNCIF